MLTWPQSSLKGLPIIIAWHLATLIPQKKFCPVSRKQCVPCTKNIRTCLCHEITPDWHKPLSRVLEEALGNSLDFHHKVSKPNRNCNDFFLPPVQLHPPLQGRGWSVAHALFLWLGWSSNICTVTSRAEASLVPSLSLTDLKPSRLR